MNAAATLSLFESAPAHDSGCKLKLPIPLDWRVDALFGGAGDCYRYRLSHEWKLEGSMVLWIMMNPSAGDLNFTDMTIAKTARISRRLGFRGQYIGNVCAYRATDRMRLLEVADPVGPRNLRSIQEMAEDSAMTIVAHGRLPGKLQANAVATCQALRETGRALYVLRLTPDGVPMHPLARGKGFIPEDVTPTLWDGVLNA